MEGKKFREAIGGKVMIVKEPYEHTNPETGEKEMKTRSKVEC